MGVVAARGVARLLEFGEVVEGEDNDGRGELGHGDDAPKPLDKVIRGLKLALEVCGIEMVGGMRKPQPADHLGIGTCNIVEEILYTLGRVVRSCGEVVDGGVEGGGKMGKVCVGGGGFIVVFVVVDEIVVDSILLLITATHVRVFVVFVVVIEAVVLGPGGGEVGGLRVVPKGGSGGRVEMEMGRGEKGFGGIVGRMVLVMLHRLRASAFVVVVRWGRRRWSRRRRRRCVLASASACVSGSESGLGVKEAYGEGECIEGGEWLIDIWGR